jgi:hypothetical protein
MTAECRASKKRRDEPSASTDAQAFERTITLDAVELVGNLEGCPSGAANPQRVLMINGIIKGK